MSQGPERIREGLEKDPVAPEKGEQLQCELE
uniref:Uncharacterized protein n=1 Tax=Utricularia reniformis TaxID=192314 RepID=A0A1Y0B3A0_9LAMI|nr:hypothetical protein AEK19_MT1700 [Utricularia reniformis]ART31880.1 hypothetical protein AEK19_MT1700 [Utricularia reniformis]